MKKNVTCSNDMFSMDYVPAFQLPATWKQGEEQEQEQGGESKSQIWKQKRENWKVVKDLARGWYVVPPSSRAAKVVVKGSDS